MNSPITTHVLNTHLGRPAAGIRATLDRLQNEEWVNVAHAQAGASGRIDQWCEGGLVAGTYRIRFDTDAYFVSLGEQSFYPDVVISFRITNPKEHYHVPLLISAHGYCTYRGS